MNSDFVSKLDSILEDADRLEQERLLEQERQQREKALLLENAFEFVATVVQPLFNQCASRLLEKGYASSVAMGDQDNPWIELSISSKTKHASAYLRYQYDPNTRAMNRTVTGADFGPLLNDLGGVIEIEGEHQEAITRNLLLFVDMHLKLWAK